MIKRSWTWKNVPSLIKKKIRNFYQNNWIWFLIVHTQIFQTDFPKSKINWRLFWFTNECTWQKTVTVYLHWANNWILVIHILLFFAWWAPDPKTLYEIQHFTIEFLIFCLFVFLDCVFLQPDPRPVGIILNFSV